MKIIDTIKAYFLRKKLSVRWIEDDKIMETLISGDKEKGCSCKVVESKDNFHRYVEISKKCSLPIKAHEALRCPTV